MALATRCPHCRTTFRVAHDQLKLRAGLVRCGACKEIFNGVENLLAGNAVAAPAQKSSPTPASQAEVSGRKEGSEHAESSQPTAGLGSAAAAAPETPHKDEQPADTTSDHPAPSAESPIALGEDPLQRMTLMDFSQWKEDDEADSSSGQNVADSNHRQAEIYAEAEALSGAPDEVERAIEDLQRKPWRRKKKKSKRGDDDEIAGDDDVTEPEFVRRARRQHRIGRALRIFMGAGSVILLVVLVGQAAYVFRNQIAASWPQSAAPLAKACAFIGCDVGLPAQIEAVSIESSELQTLSPNQNSFVLQALLRNRSSTMQAWPNIELTLNDGNEKAIARRVFLPREYLAYASDPKKGLAANSEQSIRMFFELAQLKASGYRVYLYYP
jgi:predicted Zn finger-like uncharacterized protein